MPPTRISPKLLSWATDLDDKVLGQAERSAALPFVAGHVALMPDAHWGYGATVGSVIPTEGAIVPAAVGVDIGCGMIAANLTFSADQLPDDLSPLHSLIAAAVPAGVGRGHDQPTASHINKLADLAARRPPLAADEWATAQRQIGTLGSGNHFVEVCLDERSRVWLVLHSGSRGIGSKIATRHIEAAKGLMKQYFIALPDPDLAYLVQGTTEFDDYISAMHWAQDYAELNRAVMMWAVHDAFERFVGGVVGVHDVVNCHHNFTARENHFGRNLWVTRKGAIRARVGDRGVIPGSMGAASYIVSGLGNRASFSSCSHGAGRRLGRKEARRRLTAASLDVAMAGKAWNHDAEALLDEHPDAYKDIDVVMENQRDLVTVEHTLHQVLNFKGL
jgi:tRNA-splicing ligase RtcB